MLIVTNNHKFTITKDLSKILKAKIYNFNKKIFHDGEFSISLRNFAANNKILVICEYNKNPNDYIIELILLIEILSKYSQNIILVIPYLPYSRQGKNLYDYECNSIKLFCKLLSHESINKIYTIDIHDEITLSYFNKKVTNITTEELWINLIKSKYQSNNLKIIYPDRGSFLRFKNITQKTNLDYIICNKIRLKNSQDVIISDISEPCHNKDCIIIDDIIDTGSTITKTSEYLIKNGAKSVSVFCTHGVLSSKSIDKIENSQINKIFITDTITQKTTNHKIEIVKLGHVILQQILY